MIRAAQTGSDTNEHIWVANADGSGLRQVTFGAGEVDPAWSPDGHTIVYFGFDALISNSLVYADGAATGEVVPPLIAEGEKAAAIKRICHEYDADPTQSKAYSDSFSDAPMLESVGEPVAVNPDRRLKRVAAQRGWPVLEFRRGASKRGSNGHAG